MEAEERARLEEEINSKRSEVRYSRCGCWSFSRYSSSGRGHLDRGAEEGGGEQAAAGGDGRRQAEVRPRFTLLRIWSNPKV